MVKETVENQLVKILYIGPDIGYWNNVKAKFEESFGKMMQFEFSDKKETDDHGYITLFRQIIDGGYDIVYADYSFRPDLLLKLTYLLRKNNSTKKIVVIGLFDHKTKFEICQESLDNGVLINQLKMGEDVFDTVYSAALMAFYEKVEEPNFVKLRISEGLKVDVSNDMRINYIAQDHLRLESEYPLTVDDDIELEVQIPKFALPSSQFHVSEVNLDGDRFYGKPYQIKLDYNYLDKLVLSSRADNIEKANFEEELEKRTKRIEEEVKPKFEEWFKEQETARPQYVKLLVIDSNASILDQSEGWIKSHSHGIHLQLNTVGIEQEIKLFHPSIIAVHQDQQPSELEDWDCPENYNDESALKKIMDSIKAIKSYNPYVIVFGSNKSSETMQKTYSYSNIISNTRPINIKFILDIAQMYEGKFKEDVFRSLKNMVVLARKDAKTMAIHKSPIKIINITESAFEFISERELPLYSIHKLSAPAEVYFTVIPHRKSSKFASEKNCYRGVFHTYNVANKNKLRQFIISKE